MYKTPSRNGWNLVIQPLHEKRFSKRARRQNHSNRFDKKNEWGKTREEHRLPFLSKKPKQIRSVLHQNEFCIFSFQQMNADFRRKHEKTPPRRWRVWFRSVDISRGFLFKGHSKIVHLSTTAVLKALFTWLPGENTPRDCNQKCLKNTQDVGY